MKFPEDNQVSPFISCCVTHATLSCTFRSSNVISTCTVPKIPIKIEGIKEFSFVELETATSSFCVTAQVGQGAYGKVYKGILADDTVVAIKRAQQGSVQGQKEFFTEIELLSRLHHRNLVSLLGYCNEDDEQVSFI